MLLSDQIQRESMKPSPLLCLLILLLSICGTLHAAGSEVATIRKAQQELKSQGHYAGAIDGVIGSQTAAAIRRFQLERKLKVTGQLNRQTLDALGLTPGSSKPTHSPIPMPEALALAELFSGGPYASLSTERQKALYHKTVQALNRAGFPTAVSSDAPDPEFFTTLRSWQKSVGLKPNGRIDHETATKLRL